MTRHGKNKRSKAAAQRAGAQRSNDRGVYAAILMVGLFGLVLWYLASAETFPHAVIGYALAVLGMINWFTFQAWRGASMVGWHQSLARLPLHFAGYGVKGGKPIEAAKGQDNAKIVLLVSISASIVVLVALSWLLLPDLRG